MRILITGSRDWDDVPTVVAALRGVILEANASKDDTIIVQGDCPRGADRIAKDLGMEWGAEVESHPAQWNTHGKPAGFIRNKLMVDLGADVCLAFVKNNSKGATHTVNLAQAAGIPTKIYREG